jgi:hypothetical protein
MGSVGELRSWQPGERNQEALHVNVLLQEAHVCSRGCHPAGIGEIGRQ